MFKNVGHSYILKFKAFEWTLTFVILLYLYFLREYITTAMTFFFLFTLLLGSLKFKANIPLRILFILLICLHHGLFYGLKVTTEAALNFILGMCGLKMLEQKTFRDRHLLVFVVFLLLNTALLFEQSISVFLFVIVSYFSLIFSISVPKWQWRYFINALKSVLFISPAILAIYFFFPRWNSQLFGDFSLASGPSTDTKIGLSLDVDFKNISSIQPNATSSFLAFIEPQQQPMYWRSHTISQTDGWNWERSSSDTLFFKALKSTVPKKISYKIQLETGSRYFIGLDRVQYFEHQNSKVEPDSYSISALFPNGSLQKSYLAHSNPDFISDTTSLSKADLRLLLQLPSSVPNLFTFQFKNAFELQKKLREHFNDLALLYTFEPGPIHSLEEFLKIKKGFCSHFASYLALLLRYNHIPARLVSGYLGGKWNPTGNFYRIEQNEAHVWVEAYYQQAWVRLDPTLWVSPDRAQGANNIQRGVLNSSLAWISLTLSPIKFWIDKVNSDFRLWQENFNLIKQNEIAKKWNFSLNEFHLLALLSFIIAVALMFGFIFYQQRQNKQYKNWNRWVKFWTSFEKTFPDIHLWGKIEAAENILQKLHTKESKIWLKKIKKLKLMLYR